MPVTVKVTADAGFWAFELPPLLPHPTAIDENREMKANNTSALIDRRLLRVSAFRLRLANTVPNSPRPGSRNAARGTVYPVVGGAEEAEMVKVAGVLDPGVTVVGLKAQLTPATVEQLSEIGLSNPPTPAALIVRLTERPGGMDTLGADRLREKFWPATAAAGARLPNTGVVPPVVK